MKKIVDLKKTVYEICSEYPEVKDILAGLGFHDITKAGALNTIGRFMTIPKGASMRGIDLAEVIQKFRDGGFEVLETEHGKEEKDRREKAGSVTVSPAAEEKDSRTALLKDYVRRLCRGESLAEVRKDFVAHFQSVDAAEIAKAEQELISAGTPVSEVQKLCDVHSALFHGATEAEKIANAEKAVQASEKHTEKTAAELLPLQVSGHPVSVFTAENKAVIGRISEIRKCLPDGTDRAQLMKKLNEFRAVALHYAEKGDLIYPLLKSRYNVTGPADVMWSVDDEIRDELKVLSEAGDALPDFEKRLERVLTRAEEMVYKENNILFPLCAGNFTEADWMRIYYELPAYDEVFGVRRPAWVAAEAEREKLKAGRAGEKAAASDGDRPVPLNSGHMTIPQIEAVLNTIPMEFSFIDDQDMNCFFNAGKEKKLFKRPDDAVGRNVFSCHPPKCAAMAKQIIGELRSGKQDSVDVWMTKENEPVLVRYMAVRNRNGEYAGTLECVQRMGFAGEYFKKADAGKTASGAEHKWEQTV